MTIKTSQIKLYAMSYDIIVKLNIPLMKLLFIEYCKTKLTEKQMILMLMISTLMYKSDMNKDHLYEFLSIYIQKNKHTIMLKLLNV